MFHSSFHLYIIRLKDSKKHKQTFEYLRKENIGVNLHYIPVHKHPYYCDMDTDYKDLEQSELYYMDAISIPLYPAMTNLEQDFVISTLKKALQK